LKISFKKFVSVSKNLSNNHLSRINFFVKSTVFFLQCFFLDLTNFVHGAIQVTATIYIDIFTLSPPQPVAEQREAILCCSETAAIAG